MIVSFASSSCLRSHFVISLFTEGRYDIIEPWEHYQVSSELLRRFWISTHKSVECSHQFSGRKSLLKGILISVGQQGPS